MSVVKMQFGKSSSKRLPYVIELAQKFDTYTFESGFHTIVINSDKIIENWEVFHELFVITHIWAKFKLFIDGVFEGEPFTQFYKLIANVKRCYDAYKGLTTRDLICNTSHVGCVQIKSIAFDPNMYGNYWYFYGSFSDDYKKWIIDKQKILLILKDEVIKLILNSCPVFSEAYLIESISKNIPDTIDLANGHWGIKYEKKFVGDTIKDVPKSIFHIVNYNDEDTKSTSNKDLGRTIKLYNYNDLVKQRKDLLVNREKYYNKYFTQVDSEIEEMLTEEDIKPWFKNKGMIAKIEKLIEK